MKLWNWFRSALATPDMLELYRILTQGVTAAVLISTAFILVLYVFLELFEGFLM